MGKHINIKLFLFISVFLASNGWTQTLDDPETNKKPATSNSATADKKTAVDKKPTPVDDTESDFYDEQETPPSEEMPQDTPAAEDKDSDQGALPPPANENYESNANPSDEGIEYAGEGEGAGVGKKKPSAQTQKSVVRPPADEPMPLIRRQRSVKEIEAKAQPTRIHHPLATKGLTKITKDKVYIYKVKESDQTRASTFHFGFFNPTKLENKSTGYTFDDFYTTSNPMLIWDYEWQIFQKFGKGGLKAGTGLAFASGSGRFDDPNGLQGSLEPKEKFTFVVLPVTIGAIVRLQFMKNQIIVPYGEAGGAGFLFGEFRDDGKRPKGGAAGGGYFAAGAAFCLNFLDEVSMLELDREYSINSIYATAEYRQYIGAGNFDFTAQVINGGITVEF